MSENLKYNGLSIDYKVLNDPSLYAPTLRDTFDPTLWGDISAAYIEVGQIKLSEKQIMGYPVIELWINQCYQSNQVRPECQIKKRRHLYEVLEDVEIICMGRECCVLIMEDDNVNAVVPWHRAIYPIVTYLGLLKCVKATIIYTKCDEGEILNPDNGYFLNDSDKRYHFAIYNSVDAYVAGQSNIYANFNSRKVCINNKKISVIIDKLVHL